jgi:hypothetical protein
VAELARKLGWRGPLIVAASAEDGAMFAALAKHSGCGGDCGAA